MQKIESRPTYSVYSLHCNQNRSKIEMSRQKLELSWCDIVLFMTYVLFIYDIVINKQEIIRSINDQKSYQNFDITEHYRKAN